MYQLWLRFSSSYMTKLKGTSCDFTSYVILIDFPPRNTMVALIQGLFWRMKLLQYLLHKTFCCLCYIYWLLLLLSKLLLFIKYLLLQQMVTAPTMIKTALNTNVLLLLKIMAELGKDLTAPTVFKTDLHSNNLLQQKMVSALDKDQALAWFKPFSVGICYKCSKIF